MYRLFCLQVLSLVLKTASVFLQKICGKYAILVFWYVIVLLLSPYDI